MTSSFQDRLGAELRRAASDRPRQRAIRRRLSMATVAAVLTVAATTVFLAQQGDQPAAASVRIVREDGAVGLEVTGRQTTAADVRSAAGRVGLDVAVIEQPVGPSLVGRFISWRQRGGGPDAVRLLGAEVDDTFNGFVVLTDARAGLDLVLGRPARPGESYAKFVDATTRGEALACQTIIGLSPSAAGNLAAEADVRVQWRGTTVGGSERPLTAEAVRRKPWSEFTVSRAFAFASDAVIFHLAPEGLGLLNPEPYKGPC